MNRVLFSGLALIAKQAKARFLRQVQHTDRVQQQFLRSLLQQQRQTAYGQTYGFADLRSIDQYRDRLPVQSYSHFEPYIERMVQGEQNVLVADPLIFMNLTSGSTGAKKMIPVTRRSRRAVTRATQVAMGFAVSAAERDRHSFGKMLYSGSAQPAGQTPAGVTYGPVSTSDLRLTAGLYQQIFAYPFQALQVPSIQDRNYLCLLFALSVPHLRIISATFPVLALRLAQDLNRHAEELLQDLAAGEISPRLKIDPTLRTQLERRWAPHPQRAAQLQCLLAAEGRLTPRAAWPHLSFIITARGGTSDVYFERFSDYFGDVPVFGGTYASAEATYGVHRDFNTDSVILALESGFYEFIPEDQWHVDQPQTVLPWQVRVGDRYRIIVSNYSGLYRYDVGDIVEIEGFCGNAPRFIFRHRRGGVLSASTEKTTEYHVTRVMQQLQQTFRLKLENFCVTLSNDWACPHYWVNIEIAEGYRLDRPQEFIRRFDAYLSDLHLSYALKRGEQIPAPKLRMLASGSFAQLQQRLVNRGVSEGQLKFPVVSGDRTLLAGLSVEAEVTCDG